MEKIIEIKLMSDLCAGSGVGLGSFIDTDICYDDYGIPYIPSKRIKGLLKEACLEYLAWSGEDSKICDELFGIEGSKYTGKIKIANAYINHYDEFIEEIRRCPQQYRKYLNKNSLINEFTSVRYQTAIEKELGVAKENSLRTIRVLNSSEILHAQFELDDEEYLELLEKGVLLIKHMGMNRTRGFGEVKCRIIDKNIEDKDEEQLSINEEKNYCIQLVFEAKSNLMITKHNIEETENYIPGSNILGAIASKYIKDYPEYKTSKEEFNNFKNLFLDGSIIYQNAYISDWSKEENININYIPIPFSYSQVKNEKKYYNKMFDFTNTDIQLSTMTEKFVTLENPSYIKEVELEENYHHQRAKDPSIGHVLDKENGGMLYRFASIKKHQYFSSKIIGSGKYLNQILPYIKTRDTLRVGKSKNTEYGILEIVKVDIKEVKEEKKNYQKFAAILTSPAIIIDEEKVQVSIDKDTLIKELIKKFNHPNVKVEAVKSFISYTKEAGYNILWNLPKEQYPAYEKGNVIVFTSDKEISLDDEYVIGIQNQEGYGQVKIFDLKGKDENLKFCEWEENISSIDIKDMSKYSKGILKSSIKRFLNYEMQENALELIENNKIDLNNTTIGRLLLMLKESNTYDEFMDNVNSIKDNKKLDKVKKVLKNIEKLRSLPAYQDYYSIANYDQIEENKFMLEYAKQVLIMLKIEGGKEK